jgi:hypothetical protein
MHMAQASDAFVARLFPRRLQCGGITVMSVGYLFHGIMRLHWKSFGSD